MGLLIQYSATLLIVVAFMVITIKAIKELGLLPREIIETEGANTLKSSAIMTVITLISISIVGYIMHLFKYENGNFFDIQSIWGFGDSTRYIGLMENWYQKSDPGTSSIMPLFPMLGRLLGFFLGKNYFLAGVIISFTALIVAVHYLQCLIRLDHPDGTAKKSVWYILIFPFSFCLFLTMPDSLFLAITLACFFHLRKKDLAIAGLLSLLAVLCDIRGVILIFPIVYEIIISNEKKLRNFWVCGMPLLGLELVICFQTIMFSDGLAFTRVTGTGFHLLEKAKATDIQSFLFNTVPLLVLITLIFMGTIFMIGRVRNSYLTYGLIISLLPFILLWMDNRPRMMTAVFPLFIGVALASSNKILYKIFTYSSAVILGFYLYCYIGWQAAF